MAILHLLTPAIHAAERERLPDSLVRFGIRRMLSARLRELDGDAQRLRTAFIEECARSPVAAVPDKANEQHYEVPAAFFDLVLGPHRKWLRLLAARRCATGPGRSRSIGDHLQPGAVARRPVGSRTGLRLGIAVVVDGRAAPAQPDHGGLNSASQRRFIEEQSQCRGLENLTVVTADINEFQPADPFDRVVSVEMFEHVRNHGELLRRIAGWLNPGGKLFVHHFCHRTTPYFFEPQGESDWMARYFFSGGVMPCEDLLSAYRSDLRLENQWQWNGRHYARTCDAWLANLDSVRDQVLPVLSGVYGERDAGLWLQRWRIFMMACSELFAFRAGRAWVVTPLLLAQRPAAA